ncbi:MAG TPA: hypothetical protein EYQ81_15115 [Sneathiellales bacterium]|nr:hypothetical protein [Sneathiellales bacterium]
MHNNYADPTLYVVKGPIEDAMKWVGRESIMEAPFSVNEAQIAYFAALLEDPNENYWVAEAAATRDYFPGYHNGDYARSQGVRDAYHNTMYLQGFVDRAGYAWARPDAWLFRRQHIYTLRAAVPVGERIKVALNLGILDEDRAVLGARQTGLFGFGSEAQTSFAGVSGNMALSKRVSLFAGYEMGWTKVDGNFKP